MSRSLAPAMRREAGWARAKARSARFVTFLSAPFIALFAGMGLQMQRLATAAGGPHLHLGDLLLSGRFGVGAVVGALVTVAVGSLVSRSWTSKASRIEAGDVQTAVQVSQRRQLELSRRRMQWTRLQLMRAWGNGQLPSSPMAPGGLLNNGFPGMLPGQMPGMPGSPGAMDIGGIGGIGGFGGFGGM